MRDGLDCPSCDASGTLDPVGVETLTDEHGETGVIQARYCYCTCCGKVCKVSESGKRLIEKDVQGVVIDGP